MGDAQATVVLSHCSAGMSPDGLYPHLRLLLVVVDWRGVAEGVPDRAQHLA